MLDNKVKAFFEGSDITSYRYFGAHVSKNGVDFRVYAPHAKSIALVGTFNDWDGEANPMKKDKHGIWEAHVKNAKLGDLYKYRIHQATDEIVDKMDPYAFYSELRPNTARFNL